MNTTLFSRPLVKTLRLCLGVVLLAGLALVPCPPPARAAGGFTDLGACGLPGLGWASVAWGDYRCDGLSSRAGRSWLGGPSGRA